MLGSVACKGDPAQPPPALPALAGISTVLRLPAGGGRVTAFRPDSLLPSGWSSSEGVPPLERALGYDLDERIVWAVDEDSRLIGIDLESGGWRSYWSGLRRAAVGPEGSVFVVDSAGQLVRFRRRLPAVLSRSFGKAPLALWGAINGQVLAISKDSAVTLQLIAADHSAPPATISTGPVAPSFWGELVAATEGAKLRLIRTSDGSSLRTIALPAEPSQIIFSPSGHRVYALVGLQVIVTDRFDGSRIGTIELPGETRQGRTDPSGRWLLVQPPTGDSAWVVDLSTLRHVATIDTEWHDDLPVIVGAATLLVRSGRAVEAYDLAAVPPERITAIRNGARDVWISIPWVPPQRASRALAAVEKSVVEQDRALRPDTLASEPTEQMWLQVSSSQNPDWAEDLASQLREAGHPAAVWNPEPPDESYRVVVGPYPSRVLAEAAGKRLARPYFIVPRDPRQP